MKVFVIGAGAQGNVISWVLSRSRDVEEVVLADLHLERAREIIVLNGSDKLRGEKVDAGDVGSMVKLMKDGMDMVINATLPDFNLKIMEAAYRASVNYLDMASGTAKEWTIDQGVTRQLSLHESWKEKGLAALINTGRDPGVTNVLVREAYDKMTSVSDVEIRDISYPRIEVPISLMSTEASILGSSMPPQVYENGEYKRFPPFSGREEVETEMGKAVIFLHDHEEVSTIPRFLSVKNVFFKMGNPDADLSKKLYDLGLMAEEKIGICGVDVAPRDVLSKILPLEPSSLKEYMGHVKDGRIDSKNVLFVKITGRRGGNPMKVEFVIRGLSLTECSNIIPGSSDISYLTSVSASIFSLMLLRGEVNHTGVFPPEVLESAERERFLKMVGEWNIKIDEMMSVKRGPASKE